MQQQPERRSWRISSFPVTTICIILQTNVSVHANLWWLFLSPILCFIFCVHWREPYILGTENMGCDMSVWLKFFYFLHKILSWCWIFEILGHRSIFCKAHPKDSTTAPFCLCQVAASFTFMVVLQYSNCWGFDPHFLSWSPTFPYDIIWPPHPSAPTIQISG